MRVRGHFNLSIPYEKGFVYMGCGAWSLSLLAPDRLLERLALDDNSLQMTPSKAVESLGGKDASRSPLSLGLHSCALRWTRYNSDLMSADWDRAISMHKMMVIDEHDDVSIQRELRKLSISMGRMGSNTYV